MEVTLSVKRFDPDSDQHSSYNQDYVVEMEDSATVLDGLIKVREEVDGTLALRCSCRSAICGSCAMRVNGQARLACNTKLVDIVDSGKVVVEPAGNMEVVKDLVVDFSPFWDKVRDVKPWLDPEGPDPDPDQEYLASNEAMLDLAGVMACIMCGACVSDCTVLEVDPNFLGPAALAKAYRFVADPRDSDDEPRLSDLNEYGGMWDCTRCMQCVEVCPKGVDPMGRIMSLRDKAMATGYNSTYGARHSRAFTNGVRQEGRVDELSLPVLSKGVFNIVEQIKMIPLGIRAQLAGKRPPILPHKNPDQENVRRIFNRLDKHDNSPDRLEIPTAIIGLASPVVLTFVAIIAFLILQFYWNSESVSGLKPDAYQSDSVEPFTRFSYFHNCFWFYCDPETSGSELVVNSNAEAER